MNNEKNFCPTVSVPPVSAAPQSYQFSFEPSPPSFPSLHALSPLSTSTMSGCSSISPLGFSGTEFNIGNAMNFLEKNSAGLTALSASNLGRGGYQFKPLFPGFLEGANGQLADTMMGIIKREIPSPEPEANSNDAPPPNLDQLLDVKPLLLHEVKQEVPEPPMAKKPRLTINGKRVGRPPGTFKNNQRRDDATASDAVDHHLQCFWDTCREEFTDKKLFINHVSSHFDQSTRKCLWDNCTHDPFTAYYLFATHIRSHTKEKPNKCQFEGCIKEYSRLENLKTHMRTHTGEKPYSCKYPKCEKCFTNASDRSKHENRTHSEEKPYACTVIACEKSYTDPSSLRKHFKAVHTDLERAMAAPLSKKRSNCQKNKNQRKEASDEEVQPLIINPNENSLTNFSPLHQLPTMGMPHMQYQPFNMPPLSMFPQLNTPFPMFSRPLPQFAMPFNYNNSIMSVLNNQLRGINGLFPLPPLQSNPFLNQFIPMGQNSFNFPQLPVQSQLPIWPGQSQIFTQQPPLQVPFGQNNISLAGFPKFDVITLGDDEDNDDDCVIIEKDSTITIPQSL